MRSRHESTSRHATALSVKQLPMFCLPFCLPKLAITRRTIAFRAIYTEMTLSLECWNI